MKIYFLSDSSCLLKINGVPVGRTDGFERALFLRPKERPIVEFIPLNSGMGTSFCLDEDFLFHPPEYVEIYVGGTFLALKFIVPPAPLPFLKTIALHENAFVFSLGEPEVLLFNQRTEKLGLAFDPCEIVERGNLLLIEGRNALCAVAEKEVLFKGKISRYDYSEKERTLTIVRPCEEFCRREETLVFSLFPVKRLSASLSPRKLPPSPFFLALLLQDLRLGRTPTEVLSDELAADVAALRDYFGTYTAVMPEENGGATVACPVRERVFELKTFSATIADEKIVNVARLR